MSFRRRLTALSTCLLGAGWGVSWAAVSTVVHTPDLLGLPWLQIVVGAAVASWGGVTATLGRHLAAKYENTPFHLKNELIKDGAVSITVGAVSYLAGAWYGWGPMEIGLVLLLSGYLGVRLLSVASERLLVALGVRKD